MSDLPQPITAEYLRERLSYDPETGLFRWLARHAARGEDRRWNTRYAGTLAGSPNHDGYPQIKVDRRLYSSHRLAWLYMYGAFPAAEIDHADGNRANNRIANLRLATRADQMANLKRPKTNTSGFKGVSLYRSGRWSAHIMVSGKLRHLGYFDTPQEAHAAYAIAALQKNPKFARLA